MSEKKLKHIAIDVKNYEALSRLGDFHESFNDVIGRLLLLEANRKQKQKEKVPLGATVVPSQTPNSRDSNTAPNPPDKEELAHVG